MSIFYFFSPEITVSIGLLLLLIIEILLPRRGFIAFLISLIFLILSSYFVFEQLVKMNKDFFQELLKTAQNYEYAKYY